MKRVRLEEAFEAGSVSPSGGASTEEQEAVVLEIRGGEVVAVVPAGTEDDGVVAGAASVRAALRLENERVLMVELHADAEGARFHDEPAALHAARRAEGTPGVGAVDAHGLGTVDQLMTRDVKTATPDELVEDVAKRLAFHNVTGLPVEDWDGQVIGIVSELDVIGKINETIRDVMTADVITVAPRTPIDQAATLMAQRGIKRLPVLEDGKLVGILSRADIVRALAERSSD